MRLKKILLLCLIIGSFHPCLAQNLEAKITYTLEYEDKKDIDLQDFTPNIYQTTSETSKPLPKFRNFILKIKNNEAVFASEYDLNMKKKLGFVIDAGTRIGKHDEIFYINSETDENFHQSFWTKNYLVNVEDFKWNYTTESKKIGNYLCYKATTEILSEQLYDMNYMAPVEVWYTKSIPSSFGVQMFNGLPGLTIQLIAVHEEGKVIFNATDIDLHPKEEIQIIKPTGRYQISEKEYVALIKEKTARRRGF